MVRLIRFDLNPNLPSFLHLFPGIEGMILRIVDLVELKGAVLHHLRIKAAVRGMVDILKEDAEQVSQRLLRMGCVYGENAVSGFFCAAV